MDELERLEQEKKGILEIREGERKEKQKQRKIRVLRREVRQMKQPKTIRVIRGVAKDSTRGVGMIISAGARKASPIVKQGLMNLAENSRQEYAPKKTRKIIKKVVRKKPTKKKVVKKRRTRRDEPNPFGFFR